MPQQEFVRLEAIHRFLNLEIDRHDDMQEIVNVATELLDCPISIVTLHERSKHRTLYKAGIMEEFTPLMNQFGRYLNANSSILIIPDTCKDPRFEEASNGTAKPKIRFFAGVALCTYDGHELGFLCILDVKPNELTAAQQHLLKLLAKRAVQVIEFEFSISLLKKQFICAGNAEVKLRSVFESSEACHMLISPDMQVMDFNRHMDHLFFRMYYVKLQQNASLQELLSGQGLVDFWENFTTALSGQPVRYQQQITHDNGEKVWYYTTFLPCYNPEGRVICVSYNATDITENTIHKELITVQNKSLRQIAFIQSHELRRPVATILGLMEVIKLSYFHSLPEELQMLEDATKELDERIKEIVRITQS